jgi:hypothetical protein
MPDFIPGLELSRRFFVELLQPVLVAEFPNLRYDAAVIGSGSEVLGFDTPLSRDHHWGPRVTLFLSAADAEQHAEAIRDCFRHRLPYSFLGYPTSFEEIPGEPGVLRFEPKTSGPVNHRVGVTTLRAFIREYLGLDWTRDLQLSAADWLTLPQQKLRTLTAGGLYHTALGDVPALRAQFAWYPRDIWLLLLAAGWTRISQEEAFVGRAGDVGDELGSAVIAARLVRDLMQLCFLMERQYAPYAKWFGTAFNQLACAPQLQPILRAALGAADWQTREAHLNQAYSIVAAMHNALGLTAPLPIEGSLYHQRPYTVIHGDRFASALIEAIHDPALRQLARDHPIGSLDQFSDSTDLRENAAYRTALMRLYDVR